MPLVAVRKARRGVTAYRVLIALGVIAACLVVWWWRGAKPAVGAGDWQIEAGRLTGLLAGSVAVVQVLLRARLGPIERALGTDAINSAHRLLGAYLICLVLAHATLVTFGYAAAAHSSVVGQLGSLVTQYPYVLWAVVATALLVGVAATSVPALRRRIRYGAWHAVHCLVYVALPLAFFHQVANGEQLRHNAVVRMVWTALWIAGALVIVCSRWLRPVVLFRRHRLRIVSVRFETERTVSIEITGRRLGRFPGAAGQYFRWRFLTPGHWHVTHPYSLSAEPDGSRLRITARVDGRYSSGLPQLPVGAPVVAEGPCGGMLSCPSWPGPILLVGAGVGVAPLRALLPACPPGRTTMIYRARTQVDMPLRAEIEEIAKRRDIDLRCFVGSRNVPANALSAQQIQEICPEVRRALVYVCGSGSFVRHVRRSLSELGVPRAQVRTESFELE